MNPLRTQVKFFLETETVDQSLFMGVFQRWIQRKALEGQLIDVADYRHVWEGPGILLVAHDSDYAMETRDSRLGLLYTRKRQVDSDLRSQLRSSLRLALTACALLEKERIFYPKLKFAANEFEIRFVDRLQLPNRPESFELIKADLGVVISELYGDSPVEFAPVSQDERYLLTIKVQSTTSKSVGEILNVLQPSTAT